MIGKYPRVSDTFIVRKLDQSVKSELYIPCYNLSCYLADVEGKVTNQVSSYITSYLKVTSPGIILSGGVGSQDAVNLYAGTLPPVNFTSMISSKAFYLYSDFQSATPSFVLPATVSISDFSPLLVIEKEVPPGVRDCLCSTYTECMALYLEMLEVTPEKGLHSLTKTDILRVLGNLEWATTIIENMSYGTDYQVLSVIRDLQRTLYHITTIDILFDDTYNRVVEV